MSPLADQSRGGFSWARFLQTGALPIAIVIVFAVFGVLDERVWSPSNILNIAVQASYLAIFAMAQTMVILTRGFDLSLGVSVSLASVVAALAMSGGSSLAAGLAAGVGVATAVGFVNGLFVAGAGINPFVVTLGMANIILALASTVSGGFPVTGLPDSFSAILAQGSFLGVPAPLALALVVFVVLQALLQITRFGRSLYILGANPAAARAAGIRAVPVLTAAYTLCGLLIGLGAMMLTARTGSGEPNLGGNLTLESIAAAVVGGVKLSGGEGGVGAAVLGALFITVLSNGMNLVQVDGYLQQICLGLIIIVSLIVSRQELRR